MRAIRKRLTYANVVSSIALFVAMAGGAAVAATQLPRNSVGSPQIKKNAVKTGKIARNAVRVGKLGREAVKAGKLAKNAVPTNRLRDAAVSTSKIADNAVTGAKVNEATLATVPSADTAGTADSASNVAGRTVFSFYMGPGTKDIASYGPFTIKATCVINQGGFDEAALYLFTSVDGAAMDDKSGQKFVPFDIADSPALLIDRAETTPQPNIEGSSGELIAVAPDGTEIATDSQAAGVNVAGHVGQCYFGGVLEKLG